MNQLIYPLVRAILPFCLTAIGGCQTVDWFPGCDAQFKYGNCAMPHGEGSPLVTYGQAASPFERVAELTHQLAAAEDTRKVLVGRALFIETQLEDKEQALGQANQEIENALREIIRVREEMQQMRQELLRLRTRLRDAEKENKDTLESVIRMMEQMLERQVSPAGEKSSTGETPAPAESRPPGTNPPGAP
jgi:hypothetical protein